MIGNSIEQVQDDERFALNSIYGSDIQFAPTIWKTWSPIEATIHLRPQDSESRDNTDKKTTSVQLYIKCDNDYPNSIPNIELRNIVGLSSNKERDLLKALHETAREMIGDVMIHNLCQCTIEFLSAVESKTTVSFHENMLKSIENKEAEAKRKKRDSERKELQMVDEEQEKLNILSQPYKELNTDLDENYASRMIKNRKVYIIEEITQKREADIFNRTEFIGIHNLQQYLISEWTFELSEDLSENDKESFLSKVDELSHNFQHYYDISNEDENLVDYGFFHVDKKFSCDWKVEIIKVFVAQQLRPDEECLDKHYLNYFTSPLMARRFIIQLLCGLRYLHDQNYTHSSISFSNIWVDDTVFRLSDFGILSKLRNLLDNLSQDQSCSIGKQDINKKKEDLIQLSNILNKILANCTRNHSKYSSSNWNNDIIDSFDKFISHCRTANNIEELFDDPFLTYDESLSLKDGDENYINGYMDRNNRVMKEFFVTRPIGKGGFGDVILARHRLDGVDYALKRIPLKTFNQGLNRRIIKEAKLFAKLNHPNVVRYFNTWKEDVVTKEYEGEELHNKNDKYNKQNDEKTREWDESLLPSYKFDFSSPRNAIEKSRQTLEWDPSFSNANNGSNDIFSECDEDEEISNFDHYSISEGKSSSVEICFGDNEKDKSTSEIETDECSNMDVTPNPSILVIQMEYCEKGTLRGFIDNNPLKNDVKILWTMFSELLNGLSYIHNLNYIHRDIKPLNIFLNKQLTVKIGDFGLATSDLQLDLFKSKLFQSGDNASNYLKKSSEQTRDIGTLMYMAPELSCSEKSSRYNSKIDVYSAGVVLFEMLYKPLPPGMERISTINKLKTQFEFPEDFANNFSIFDKTCSRKIIERMLKRDPNERPTVDELLNEDIFPKNKPAEENFKKKFQDIWMNRKKEMRKWIIDHQFSYNMGRAENYCYDLNICTTRFSNHIDDDIESMCKMFSTMLKLRCFEFHHSHIFVPVSKSSKNERSSWKEVQLLNGQGATLSLPTSSRQNFIRYCARNAVNRLKCFDFGKVFWCDSKGGNNHPYEQWEFSVDIIGPGYSSISLQTEVLWTACQLINSSLNDIKLSLRIGHAKLFESVLKHLRISNDAHNKIYKLFHLFSNSDNKMKKLNKIHELTQLIGEENAKSFLNKFPNGATLNDLKDSCRLLLRSKDESVSCDTQEALNELESIYELLRNRFTDATRLNVTFDSQLLYRPEMFQDGLIFQIIAEVPTRKGTRDICVLAGGRYDSALQMEQHPRDVISPLPRCMVGFSIFMDFLLAVKNHISDSSNKYDGLTVLICSMEQPDRDLAFEEKFKLASELWMKNIKADIIHEPILNIDELNDYCKMKEVKYLLVITQSEELILKTSEGVQKKMSSELAIKKIIEDDRKPKEKSHKLVHQHTGENKDEKSSTSMPYRMSYKGTATNFNLRFACERRSFKDKKKLETSVYNHLSEYIGIFSSATRIEVILSNLPIDVINELAGNLVKKSSYDEINNYFESLLRQHHRFSNDLEYFKKNYVEIIQNYIRNSSCPYVIIAYQQSNNFYRVFT